MRQRFLELLEKDILQLDLAELDFGIYRILSYRRAEIDAFLDRELPQRIDTALAKLPGVPTEDEQGRIFHHLYTFFSRYYDGGDFVMRPRRGRNAAYSVPYNGQDVHFWWATKGSHYVKSGERFTSYVWRDGPRAVRIEVVRADVEKDNVKGAKRYYLPESIAERGNELVVRLAYQPLDKDEAKRFEKNGGAAAETGNGDDGGDDGEAPAGRTPQERILNAWLADGGPRKAKIPAGVDKALLGKHLARYVAGQTRDFFVHPDLGEFLAGELDYYLKNEFLEIWDRADGDALARERGKLAVVRDIGLFLAAFLASIEDVQAQLFEKRKFVLRTDWLVRASALPKSTEAQALIEESCTNADQVNEWLAWLGEEPLKGAASKKPGKRGAELLADNPHLCLHTRHFDEAFKHCALALFDDIDRVMGGALIHSENYAALRTLAYSYQQRLKCTYIDPPYNTGSDGFAYKDALQHSSWASMLSNRLLASKVLHAKDGVTFVSINEVERIPLELSMRECFGAENRIEELIWVRDTVSNNAPTYSTNHEYIEAYALDRSVVEKSEDMFREVRPGYAEVEKLIRELQSGYPAIATIEGALSDLYSSHRAEYLEAARAGNELEDEAAKNDPWKGIYPYRRAEYRDRDGRFVPESDAKDSEASIWVWREVEPSMPAGKQSASIHDPKSPNFRFYQPPHPKTKSLCKPPKRGWAFPLRADENRPSFESYLNDSRIVFKSNGSIPQLKYFLHEVETVVSTSVVRQNADGEPKLEALFGVKGLIDNPKPPDLIRRLISQVTRKHDVVADYFAGSGTTGHAVINLNREDGGERRFMLVEQGEYFDTVLLPRIAKVIACPEWKDGKPKATVAMRPADDMDAAAHWSERSPKLVQVLRLERYEDSLDALELPSEENARRAGQMSFAGDTLLRYVHEAAAGKGSVTLNHAGLARPFDYVIPQTQHGTPALVPVDLATTALLLLGLHPVRIRDVQRKQDKVWQRYLFVEARPNGKPKELHLLFLRDCDDALTGEVLRRQAESEMRWLDETIAEHFGMKPAEYATIWYNRNAVLSSPNGRSLDPEVIRRMLERAPRGRGV